ncbi:putative signal peptide peptidase SppA [Hartmannibacter diazotrophicus]|uniref:Putative signal peptide peptidase SppA n=1 Tax=Hartmannibacter diazotrophicus TaxID=1482074 RepID=A0A2C9D364_9HYPH|nr:S49 family peptidase [Hartmannibacter diazotrophicus]SON54704.1 putative signal peptide peptidase SppA [Hartmannibacter diazotrophicus]
MSKSLNRFLPSFLRREGVAIPVVRMSGVIGSGGVLRRGLSLASVTAQLDRAFADKKAPAVAILVNSPGGSPVQSHFIFQRIRQLAEEKSKPVLVYVEDVAASGGYMIACAGDEIIADPCSIVGSIGVVSAGFGLDKAIEKLGIDRRVYTAGTRKVTLDPFLPENGEDVEHLKNLQKDIHKVFINLVKSRRGEALSQSEDLFSGLFWAGDAAHALGLIDRVGDMRQDLKARYGEKTTLRFVGASRGFLRRQFGASLPGQAGTPSLFSAEELIGAAEERLYWSRFGL